MNPAQKTKFGRVDLEVTAFGFGTAPVGNIFREIDEQTSDAMFQTAWDAGVRYFDTAPMYGHGLAELRTGKRHQNDGAPPPPRRDHGRCPATGLRDRVPRECRR